MLCCTLGRWSAEYGADGEDVFSGSGNPVANKDYEILKLKKENEELRKEVAILKNPGLLETSPSVRFEFVRTSEHGMSVKKVCGALGVSRGGKASDKRANVLNRELSIQKRNSAWRGDITYIPTGEGWLYLATYLDLFSRKIVGWQVSPRINENLAIDALDNAVNRENPEEGFMVHTDRGSQCTSSRFCRELESRGFVQLFSRKGCPYDNAVMESFFKTPKRELPLDRRYDTRG